MTVKNDIAVYIDSSYDFSSMRASDICTALAASIGELLPGSELAAMETDPSSTEDIKLAIKLKGGLLRLRAEVVSQPNLARIREKCDRLLASQHGTEVPVLVAPFLNPEMRRFCRARGVQYLDLSGNAWLETPHLLIQKEVSKNLYPHQAKRRSPFADRASLILRFLLTTHAPVAMARIAAATGLDSGYVSRIIESAQDLRYATVQSDGLVRLINQEELLRDWTAEYTWKRNKADSYFMKDADEHFVRRLADVFRHTPDADCALTMHGGNNLVAPFTSYGIWHAYIGDLELEHQIVKSLSLELVPKDAGNVVLMAPYYRSSVFFGSRVVEGVPVVSDVQLFLDLRNYPVRGTEASDEVLGRRLKPKWSAP